MPELPEVQHVCESLAAHVLGKTVRSVRIYRPDVVRGLAQSAALLRGDRIANIMRHGKQIALVTSPTDAGRPCVCIHLGMSGSLQYRPTSSSRRLEPHTHVSWTFADSGRLLFIDPRRFGGIWTFPDRARLWTDRWQDLGPDALSITPKNLHQAFQHTSRCLKSALLDQRLIAGLGNIYVDELLFACRLHPLTRCNGLPKEHLTTLVRRMRRLLNRAIRSGGSTVRSYVNSNGREGRFQQQHHVYARAGLPCSACGCDLSSKVIAGRTTVFCGQCQRFVNGPLLI